MAAEIIGYVTHTRQTETTGLWWSDDFDIDYIEQTALAHERAGFDSVLIGADSWGPDSWQIAAHVLRVTTTLKVLIAHRPGFVQPTVAARQAITLDKLSGGGRIALHIISGSPGGELLRDGDTLPLHLRYARTAEYMKLLRAIWSAREPFNHRGDFYQFEQGFSAICPDAPLTLSFGGSSPEAIDVGAQYADKYMLWGEPLAGIAECIHNVCSRAQELGRPSPGFSVSLRAIIGATEADAWQRAEHIYVTAAQQLAQAGKAPATLTQGAFKLHSVGAQRLNAYAHDNDVHDERLWLGFTRLVGRGGSTSALVGTVDQVVEAYLRYYDLGAHAIYLRGWDIAADAEQYGRQLIPALRAATQDRGI